eukprot:1153981-Pelagomonas_calceolata.AAC.4
MAGSLRPELRTLCCFGVISLRNSTQQYHPGAPLRTHASWKLSLNQSGVVSRGTCGGRLWLAGYSRRRSEEGGGKCWRVGQELSSYTARA